MGPWGFSWFGAFLLIVGALWLADTLGYFDFRWDLVGPIVLILIGLSILFGRRRRPWMWGAWDERPRQPPPPPP